MIFYHLFNNVFLSQVGEFVYTPTEMDCIVSVDIQKGNHFHSMNKCLQSTEIIFDLRLLKFCKDVTLIHKREIDLKNKSIEFDYYFKYMKQFLSIRKSTNKNKCMLNFMPSNIKINLIKTVKQTYKQIVDEYKNLDENGKQRYNNFILKTFKTMLYINSKQLNFDDIVFNPSYRFGFNVIGRFSSIKHKKINVLQMSKSQRQSITQNKYSIDFRSFIFQFAYKNIFGHYSNSIYDEIDSDIKCSLNKGQYLKILFGYDKQYDNIGIISKFRKYQNNVLNEWKDKNEIIVSVDDLPVSYNFSISFDEKNNENKQYSYYIFLQASLYGFYLLNKLKKNVLLFIHDEFVFDKIIEDINITIPFRKN